MQLGRISHMLGFLEGAKQKNPEKNLLRAGWRTNSNSAYLWYSMLVESVYPYGIIAPQSVQHRVFPDGHPSGNYPHPTELNFGEQAGTAYFLWTSHIAYYLSWDCILLAPPIIILLISIHFSCPPSSFPLFTCQFCPIPSSLVNVARMLMIILKTTLHGEREGVCVILYMKDVLLAQIFS